VIEEIIFGPAGATQTLGGLSLSRRCLTSE
jgi:hypothetical protein